MRNWIRAAALLFLVLGIAEPLWAQNDSAMTGVVTDVTGALVANVHVTLTNPRTGVKFNAVTGKDGAYRFPLVPPREGYVATFDSPGFSSVRVERIDLTVGSTRTQNATLQVGTNVSVDVTANSSVTLNTTDASLGNNFDVALVNELPVQNRSSPAALFYLQPGVSDNGSVTGARTDQTSITLDGMDVNDIAAGSGLTGIVGNAPVDAIQEFKGSVAGLPSVLGTGSGGQFQLVTKSGSNQFHGDLNEYHRDTTTEANSWFNNVAGVPRTALIQNQFGGAIGGPILRDKLFFFFDFNTSRIIQSSSGAVTVPLDSFRAGNVSYINSNPGCDPQYSRQNTTPDCITSLTPSQVAAIDPQHVGADPSLLTFINDRYPHANDLTGGDGVNTGLFRFTVPTPNISYNYVGRVDYNLTPKQLLFARILVARQSATQTLPEFPNDPITHPFNDQSYGYVVSHTWQIGAKKVNQAYYGDNISVYNFGTTFDPEGANVYGFSGLTSPYSSPSVQRRRVPIPEVRDDFNWQVGNHTIGFGGTFKFIKTNSRLVNDFNFLNAGTGGNNQNLDSSVRPGDIADSNTAYNSYDQAFALNLGRVASLSRNINFTANGTALDPGTGAVRRYRFFQTELYAGDTWKVTPQLTLSYGLRYQLYSVPYETAGLESVPFQQGSTVAQSTFDHYFSARVAQSAAGISSNSAVPFISYNLGGKANNGPNLYSPSYKDLAPRFAFAWNPASDPKFVLSGGAGLVYDRTVINAVNFIQDQSSYLFQNSTNRNYGDQDATQALLTDPRVGANLAFPAPPAAAAINKPYTPWVDADGVPSGLADSEFNEIVDPSLKDPYSITYNLGMQREVKGHVLFTMSYVGRLGRRLLASADASQIVDFPDQTSGELLSTAFSNVTRQLRAGVSPRAVAPQPWFENQVGTGYTRVLARSSLGPMFDRGDFGDFVQALSAYGLVGPNIGMPSQFAENTFLTNKGFSSYNGLLLTAKKSLANGIEFHFNYTWSHSVDNVSAPANFIAAGSGYGFICDVTRPRECRAASDFDVRHQITADFIAQLPVGRGRHFLANTPRYLDEVVGGWELSGIPQWRSGYPYNPVGNAYVTGYANNAPSILVGNLGDLSAKVHKASNGVVTLFDQAKGLADFVGPVGLDIGSRNDLRGPTAFQMDMGLAKTFALVGDRVVLKFRADAFNVFNHPVFNTPINDITSGQFGQITSTFNGPRVAQFALRLEF